MLFVTLRQDRYAGLSGPGSYRGGLRGGRGGFRGGLRGGGGFRGGFRGGLGGGGDSGRSFDNNLYADYSGPDSGAGAGSGGGGSGSAGYGAGGGFGSSGGFGGSSGFDAEPSQQVMVRNLPYSTANEDLVELFETTGTVELAEILCDGARPKGAGVVQFANVQEAETAIGM